MDFKIDETTGNLTLSFDDAEEREEVTEFVANEREHGGYDLIGPIMGETGLSGNSDLDTLRPEDVGGLTDSPIIGMGIEYDPDGVVGRVDKVWWFPNYMVTDPVEVLLTTGSVTFTAAPE